MHPPPPGLTGLVEDVEERARRVGVDLPLGDFDEESSVGHKTREGEANAEELIRDDDGQRALLALISSTPVALDGLAQQCGSALLWSKPKRKSAVNP